MAAIADGCVLVARAGRTHPRLPEAIDRVPQEGRRGVVLDECEAIDAVAPSQWQALFIGSTVSPLAESGPHSTFHEKCSEDVIAPPLSCN